MVSQEGDDDLEMGGQEVGVVEPHEDDEAWDDMGDGESGEEGAGKITPSSGGADDDGDGKK